MPWKELGQRSQPCDVVTDMSFASLPYELVVRICRFNAHRLHYPSSDPGDPVQDTVAASQVCSHWRSIVLSAPELWRFSIDPYHPCALWRELLLKRSEPLSIEFKDLYSASEIGLSLYYIKLQMQSEMHLRLQRYDVRFEGRGETIPSYTPPWPSYPGAWPQLQHLSLTIESDRDAELVDESISRAPDRLPDHFPGLATPVLEHLSLVSCYMPDWDQLRTIGATLTHLVIYNPRFRLCPDRWIGIFLNLPLLEDLQIVSAVEVFCDHGHTNSRFNLEVESFSIEDFPYACESFLDRIEPSPKRRQSGITFHRNSEFEFELGFSEGSLRAVSSQIQRLYSPTMADNSKLTFYNSAFIFESGLIEPSRFSYDACEPVVSKYSHSLSIHLDEGGTNDVSFLPAILYLIWPMSPCVGIIKTGYQEAISDRDSDILLEFLVCCRNLRFMMNVDRLLWERIHERVMSYPVELVNDAAAPLFPKLRLIGFRYGIQIKKESTSGDWISLEDLKAFIQRTENLEVPLDRPFLYKSGNLRWTALVRSIRKLGKRNKENKGGLEGV